ncbi:ISL3 family transposase [Clostridium perfringens]|uniref:ISL3 family transposase n=1 Tax=Clostridium perfringens TaxID=1502 RepID=UPI00096AA776|nr:ISL3 family transposase [Clostridium perfringens]
MYKCYGNNLVKHSINERLISDVQIHGKRTKIQLIHRRYKCKDCGYSFYQLLNSVESDGKITKRLSKQLQKEALTKPFLVVAEDYGVSKTTVRREFDKFVKEHNANKIIKAPRVIGIDEAHLNKTMRGVITDVENNKLIEILPNMYKSTIKTFIGSMEGYENIEVATMDMASGYRYAMKELVPDCLCVIDKFHVVQYAQMALDRVRIDYKNSLKKADKKLFHKDKWLLQSNKEDLSETDILKRDEILESNEVLMNAYWFKEMVRDMYKLKTKREAYEWFYQLEKAIPKGNEYKAFKELMKTYNKVKPEIMNYFDARYTNAYTESVNNLIKRVEKQGNGYSFEVLRAKVLYGTQQPKKPKFGENGFRTVSKAKIVD